MDPNLLLALLFGMAIGLMITWLLIGRKSSHMETDRKEKFVLKKQAGVVDAILKKHGESESE